MQYNDTLSRVNMSSCIGVFASSSKFLHNVYVSSGSASKIYIFFFFFTLLQNFNLVKMRDWRRYEVSSRPQRLIYAQSLFLIMYSVSFQTIIPRQLFQYSHLNTRLWNSVYSNEIVFFSFLILSSLFTNNSLTLLPDSNAKS